MTPSRETDPKRRAILAKGLRHERTIRRLARRGEIALLADHALRLVRLDTHRALDSHSQRAMAGRAKGTSDDELRRLTRHMGALSARDAAARLIESGRVDAGSADWMATRIRRIRQS